MPVGQTRSGPVMWKLIPLSRLYMSRGTYRALPHFVFDREVSSCCTPGWLPGSRLHVALGPLPRQWSMPSSIRTYPVGSLSCLISQKRVPPVQVFAVEEWAQPQRPPSETLRSPLSAPVLSSCPSGWPLPPYRLPGNAPIHRHLRNTEPPTLLVWSGVHNLLKLRGHPYARFLPSARRYETWSFLEAESR